MLEVEDVTWCMAMNRIGDGLQYFDEITFDLSRTELSCDMNGMRRVILWKCWPLATINQHQQSWV